MAHVYLAYHHADTDLAAAIQQRIAGLGLETWLNPAADAGDTWPRYSQPMLENAFMVLALLSPDSVAASAAAPSIVTVEWAYAWGAGIHVIPVLVGAVTLPAPLRDLEPLDFAGPEPDWDALLAQVRKAAHQTFHTAVEVMPGASALVEDAVNALMAQHAAERLDAVTQLSALNLPDARYALRQALAHPVYPDVRQAAALALGDLGDLDALPGLGMLLSDPNPQVALEAAQALARLGQPALPVLVRALTGANRTAQRAAVLGLVALREGDSVPALIDALAANDWYVRRSAAIALGRSGSTRAIAALKLALHHQDDHLRQLARRALEQIGTPEALAASTAP